MNQEHSDDCLIPLFSTGHHEQQRALEHSPNVVLPRICGRPDGNALELWRVFQQHQRKGQTLPGLFNSRTKARLRHEIGPTSSDQFAAQDGGVQIGLTAPVAPLRSCLAAISAHRRRLTEPLEGRPQA